MTSEGWEEGGGKVLPLCPSTRELRGQGGGGAGLQLLQMEAECHKAGICLFSDTREEQ